VPEKIKMKIAKLMKETIVLSCLFAASNIFSTAIAGEVEWQKYSRSGAAALQEGNFGLAERMFKLAVKESEGLVPQDLRVAGSLTNLGVLYVARNQPLKAQPLFEKAISIKQNCLGGQDPEVIMSVGKLCQFYIVHGQMNRAEPLIVKLNSFGESVILPRQDNPAEDLDMAILFDNLGASLKSANKLALAEDLFKTALAIREKTLPPEHAALASSYEHLAKTYLMENKFSLAEPFFKRALDVSIKAQGEQNAASLAKLDEYADCYARAGDVKVADQLFKKEVAIAEKAYGKQSTLSANAHLALGTFLLKQGRYSEAATNLGHALTVFEKTNGPQHLSLAPILDSYSEALEKSNRKLEAKKLAARARDIRG